jgi:hypothetical protein
LESRISWLYQKQKAAFREKEVRWIKVSLPVEQRSLVAQPKFQLPTIKKFINRNICMDLKTKGRTTINEYLCTNLEASKLL